MTKKKTIIWIFAILILATIVYAAVLRPYLKFQQTNVRNPDNVILKEVSCDATVTNPRGIPIVKNGDLVIESVNCVQQFVNSCARFGLFSDKGTLRLESEGGLGSATDVKIGEGSSQSYTLSWCGSKLARNFKLKLFNEDNQIIQTKEVTLQ